MDIYDVRSQLKAIELMPREYSVLADFFCKEDAVLENDKAIYDFRKGGKPMAPVVHYGTGGVIMERRLRDEGDRLLHHRAGAPDRGSEPEGPPVRRGRAGSHDARTA